MFQDRLPMWVFEEMVDGEKLTEIINTKHENVKYLPGIDLPENLVAVPDVEEACKGATLLVFVMPHQFLSRVLPKIKSVVAPGCRAISLIKGIDYDEKGFVLVSNMIKEGLGCDVSVLMGAQVANEMAKDQFCETTIGYENKANGETFRKLFDSQFLRVLTVNDVAGPELCGALKNIVALGAGFADGLGLGGNTKAAIIRIGLAEMMKFSRHYVKSVKDETFFSSCGLADLITTCFGGRNRKCAEAFVKTGKPWATIEQELLGGQKLQGTLACEEMSKILERDFKDPMKEFPLLTTINRIAFGGAAASTLIESL